MTPLHHSTSRRLFLLAAAFVISGSLIATRHPPPPAPRVLTREFVDAMLANTEGLATAARFVPRLVDGRPRGVKLYAIRPGSYIDQLGLKNGDTLVALNGFDLSVPDQALEAYAHTRGASHVLLDLERRGERVTLEYVVQ